MPVGLTRERTIDEEARRRRMEKDGLRKKE